jgi:hypothetical protein
MSDAELEQAAAAAEEDLDRAVAAGIITAEITEDR